MDSNISLLLMFIMMFVTDSAAEDRDSQDSLGGRSGSVDSITSGGSAVGEPPLFLSWELL